MTLCTAQVIALTQPLPHTNLPSAEALVAYCARVSNPGNQDNHETGSRLLDFCIRNRHWSIFQMANAVVEVVGPRDITRQFTRHESLVVMEDQPGDFQVRHDGIDLKAGGVQEFSQRYAAVPELISRQMRLQDHKDRQNSIEADDHDAVHRANQRVERIREAVQGSYSAMLDDGIAKENARVVLPEGMTQSRLYVNGNLRSWMHFIDVRTGGGTQREHVELARAVREALVPHFPKVIGNSV